MPINSLQTITTPKKRPGYHLRSRLVTFDGTPKRPLATSSLSSEGSNNIPGSPTGPNSFQESTTEVAGASPTEGIVGEEVPDHIFEQCNEALAEEVKALQVGYMSLSYQVWVKDGLNNGGTRCVFLFLFFLFFHICFKKPLPC